jgi:hypothetical protein
MFIIQRPMYNEHQSMCKIHHLMLRRHQSAMRAYAGDVIGSPEKSPAEKRPLKHEGSEGKSGAYQVGVNTLSQRLGFSRQVFFMKPEP